MPRVSVSLYYIKTYELKFSLKNEISRTLCFQFQSF
jgi:hypothetical protein